MNILHITDLHINNPKDHEEALREAFYPEYLDKLIQKINNDQSIDFIFVTGDIVNHAKVDNYSHAFEVLKYFSIKLNVPIENVYVINGNHDVDRKTGSLNEFNAFAAQFNTNKNKLTSGTRYELYKATKDNAILCLNSIGSSFANGHSSPLNNAIKDEIVCAVRKNKICNLFVLSHHPAESYETQNQAPFDESDNMWSEKHIWPDGGSLYKRLSSKSTISGLGFWFAGDVHRNEYALIDGSRVLSVVSCLNATSKSTSKRLPEVRVISENNYKKSTLYCYSFSGHNGTGLEGEWESKESPAYPIGNDNQASEKQDKNTVTIEPIQTTILSSKISLICEEFEKQIHDEIANRRLYEFGRFDTSTKLISLSWVSTQGLLQDYPLFSKVINSFKKQIEGLIPKEVNKKECILIGIDLWGAILSSRLGTATNIPNCCVAIRSQRDSYDEAERINKTLKNIVQGKKIIFVISDVIATGRSISTTYDTLKGTNHSSWYNLAILCDPSQNRGSCFENYTGNYYLCGSVKMPIIENDKLPSLDLLSANISFIK